MSAPLYARDKDTGTMVELEAEAIGNKYGLLTMTTSGIADSTGTVFNPDVCSHAYTYSSGNLLTDTATDGVNSWRKTYTYTGTDLTTESKWVKL